MSEQQATSEKDNNETEKRAEDYSSIFYDHGSTFDVDKNSQCFNTRLTSRKTPLQEDVSPSMSRRCNPQTNDTGSSEERSLLRKGRYEEVNEPILWALFNENREAVSSFRTWKAGRRSRSPAKVNCSLSSEKTRLMSSTSSPNKSKFSNSPINLYQKENEDVDELKRTQITPLSNVDDKVDSPMDHDMGMRPKASLKDESTRPLWDINTMRITVPKESNKPGYPQHVKNNISVLSALTVKIDSISSRLDVMERTMVSKSTSNEDRIAELAEVVGGLKNQIEKNGTCAWPSTEKPSTEKPTLKRRNTLVLMRNKAKQVRKLEKQHSLRKLNSAFKDKNKSLRRTRSLPSFSVLGEEIFTGPSRSNRLLDLSMNKRALLKDRTVLSQKITKKISQNDLDDDLISKEVANIFKKPDAVQIIKSKQKSRRLSSHLNDFNFSPEGIVQSHGAPSDSTNSEKSRESEDISDRYLHLRKWDSEEKSDSTPTDQRLRRRLSTELSVVPNSARWNSNIPLTKQYHEGQPKLSSNRRRYSDIPKSSNKRLAPIADELTSEGNSSQLILQKRSKREIQRPHSSKHWEGLFRSSVLNNKEQRRYSQPFPVDTIAELDLNKSDMRRKEPSYLNSPKESDLRSKIPLSKSVSCPVRPSTFSKVRRSTSKFEQKGFPEKGRDTASYRGNIV